MTTDTEDTLLLAHCSACGAHSFPAQVPGCRVCGSPADKLNAVPAPGPLRLLNFVTVHSELAPGLKVPCVVGEVQLAPGVVEEALIAAEASALSLDMPLQLQREMHGEIQRWVFAPLAGAAA